ncbi:MAG: aminotransferase class V-fold PLP-dependent enzyme [Actinobacteria bacterium]|nr:MAG: aminotransferase class V-fold PLP-dependent enzyme [Actinomycetota bacterium]
MVERSAYLNTGTFGPLPRRAVEAMSAQERSALERGRAGAEFFENMGRLREELRERLRRLLNAPDDSIALTTSTTDGCNIAVASLDLGPDDEVVTTDVEHPGLLGALEVSKATVRVAAVRDRPPGEALSAIEAAIGDRTRLIALSHVAWTTGAVLPIRELSGRGIPVVVDGAQAAGALPVDVGELGCDFYTVSAQKWLLGPEGTGCLYVRPERVEELRIPFPSYLSWDFERGQGGLVPRDGALRFEPGWISTGALAGLLASLEFAEQAGPERFARARAMAARCRELVAERAKVVTAPAQGTLVSWRVDGDAAALDERLEARGVIVRSLPGVGWLRASCGFWTDDEDLERLASALDAG